METAAKFHDDPGILRNVALYISKTKVEDLVADLPESFWNQLSAKLAIGVAPVQLEVSLRERRETRSAIREQIEKTLRKRGKLGELDDPPRADVGQRRYVVGDLAMRWAVHEEMRPQIVWFLGSTEQTLVALGGRARHLTHVYADELKDKAPSDARLHHVERSVVAELARRVEPEAQSLIESYTTGSWVQDVLTVDAYWDNEAESHVNFLAVVEEQCLAGACGPGNPPKGVLLGSPVFLFRTG